MWSKAGGAGISLGSGGQVSGDLVNTGTIVAGVTGIRISTNVIGGGISNSGLISVAGGTTDAFGIRLTSASTVNGGIVNMGTIRVDQSDWAVGVVVNGSELRGGITNSGLISITSTGIYPDALGVHIDNGHLAGGIVNTGRLSVAANSIEDSASVYAIKINSSSLTGGIVNHGTIEAIAISQGTTANAHGIRLSASILAGGITNSGLIRVEATSFASSAYAYGINLSSASSLSGGIVNTGTIMVSAVGGGSSAVAIGIALRSGSNLDGGITNSGLILARTAISIGSGSTLSGGIQNLGTIQGGTSGFAIHVNDGSTLTGGITNSGLLIGGGYSGAAAISISTNAVLSGGITNVGLIAGRGGDAIQNYNSSNTIDIINTVSGSQVGTIVGAVQGYANVSNSGLWALHAYGNVGATVSSNISGNYNQYDNGTLRFAANGDGTGQYSTLTVGGSATFVDAANLDIRFASTSTLSGNALTGVINAVGGITNAGTFNVTDNSAIWDYSVSGTGSSIDLNAYVSNAPTGTINTAITQTGLVAFDATTMLVDYNGSITGVNTGIKVLAGGINGSVTNRGYISGNQYGILVSSSANLTGGISNNGGSILGTVGIQIAQNATVQGGIVNETGGYISSINNAGKIGSASNYGAGIYLSVSTVGGGITNSGLIQSRNSGIGISSSQVSGGINNSGTIISMSSTGIRLIESSLSGVITNSGKIESLFTGVRIRNSYVTGDVNNSGVIVSRESDGIRISSSNLVGDILNSGTIVANANNVNSGQAGISVYSNASIVGSLLNQGSIQGDYGVLIQGSHSSGTWGSWSAYPTIGGAIINSGTIVGSVAGISVSLGYVAQGITNTGLIAGLSGVAIVNQNSGNTLEVINTISGGAQVGTIVGAINGDVNITNAGLWALQRMVNGTIAAGTSVATSISGNYTQLAGGTLQIGVNGSYGSGTLAGNYSTLTVGGTADFSANSAISVMMSASHSVLAGGILSSVVTSGGGITSNGFSITDNSALVNFNYSTATGALDLIAYANNSSCGSTVSGNVTGPCEVAFDAPNLYVANTGSITSASQGVKVLSGTINGRILNEGYIGGNLTGVQFLAGSSLSGGITNAGSIVGAIGIKVANGARVSGGIVNTVGGYISSINNAGQIGGSGSNLGVLLAGSSIGGGITNSGTILGSGSTAIAILSGSTLAGGLINQGSISQGNVYLDSSVVDFIDNLGTIVGNPSWYGINVEGGSTVTAGITNSGYISGIIVQSGSSVDRIVNSGSIVGFVGINVASGSQVLGGIINTVGGYISSINNAGQIGGSGAGVGIEMGQANIGGGITNSGLIQGSGFGIMVSSNSTLSGGIHNTATVQGGFAGIYVDGNSLVDTGVTNSGSISGGNAIAIGSGGILLGGIANTGVIASTLGVAITNQNSTNPINVVNTLSGTQVGTIVGAINGYANVTNAGLWALQSMAGGTITAGTSVASSISGNYSQLAGGTLQIGVNGSSGSGTTSGDYSSLNVGGSASFATNSGLIVSMNADHSILAGGTLVGVVTAGAGITSSGFIISDNSALVGFNYSTASGSLDLIAFGASSGCGATVSGALTGPCDVAFDAPNAYIASTGSISGGAQGIRVLSGSVNGRILNEGFIGGNLTGVQFQHGASLSGGITNAGSIEGVIGVDVQGGAAVLGGIINTVGGYISSINNAGYVGAIGSGSYSGIRLVGSTITGGITNSGTIEGGWGGAIHVKTAVLSGGITNSVLLTSAFATITLDSNATVSGGIHNLAGGTIYGQTGIIARPTAQFDSIDNAGAIIGSTWSGIEIAPNATLTGNISNSGYIEGTYMGIAIVGGTQGGLINGSIINSGSIVGDVGIGVGSNAVVQGGVTNTGGGYISSISNDGQIGGISVLSGATLGQLNNQGIVTATGAAVYLNNATLSGNLTNSGLIGGLTGIQVDNGGVVLGSIDNSGTIIGDNRGILANGSSISGNLINMGLISGVGFHGVTLYGSQLNAIDNSGSISGFNTGLVVNSSSLSAGITNSGTISAIFNGIELNQSTISGALMNAGQIAGANGIGLWVNQSALQAITNTGTVQAQGAGIRLMSGTSLSGNLVNSGLISSGYSQAGLVITGSTLSAIVNSGTITGPIGMAIFSSVISNGVTNTGLIQGVNGAAISVVGAMLDVANAVSGTQVGTIVGAINGSATVTNDGLWVLQSAYNGSTYAGSPVSASISGNYSQGATGMLQIGVNGNAGDGTTSGNYSSLTVGGSANFAANSRVHVVMSEGNSVLPGGILQDVVTAAGGVTSTGFNITDNSALVSFNYVTVGGELDLVAVRANACESTISGSRSGPCEVAFDAPNLYVASSGTISGGAQGVKALSGVINGRILNEGYIGGNLTGVQFLAGSSLSGGITNAGSILGAVGINVQGGAAILGGIINTVGGYISSINNAGQVGSMGASVGLAMSGSSISSGITNSGTISGASYGMTFFNSTLVGGIANTGRIEGNGAYGVYATAGALEGGFYNAGQITAAGSMAVGFNGTALSGGFTNAGLIQGGNYGIVVQGFATLSGGMNNSGTVIGLGTSDAGIIAVNSRLTGGITNGGYIGGARGVRLYVTDVADGFANSGLINATGSAHVGVALSNGALTGGFTNTGTISGSLTIHSAAVSGGVRNSGSIAGIRLTDTSSVLGGLTNSGQVGGVDLWAGVALYGSGISGGITNSGAIYGEEHGILLQTGATLAGGINNLAGSTISALNTAPILGDARAIHLLSSAISGGITNAGLVRGHSFATSAGWGVGLSMQNSTVSGTVLNTGSIIGDAGWYGYGIQAIDTLIDGSVSNTGLISGFGSVSGAAIALSSNATVTGNIFNSGLINGGKSAIYVGGSVGGALINTGTISAQQLNAISLASDAIVMGGVTNTGLVAGVSGLAITNQNTITALDVVNTVSGTQVGTIVGAINGNANITNAGLWALQSMAGGTIAAGTSVASSISGSYSQLAGGTLQIGVNGSSGSGTIAGSYSSLTVGGFANFAANSAIKVMMSADHSVMTGGTLVGVVTASGGLTSSGFVVSDNSALVDFRSVTTADALSLVAYAGRDPNGSITGFVTGPALVAFDAPNLVVANTGTIGNGQQGVQVLSGLIDGHIVNQGSIGGVLQGIQFGSGARLTGGLTNSGVITGNNAIELVNATLAGGLGNSGQVVGVNYGLYVDPSIISGGITNSGLLQGTSSTGMLVSASTVIGGINNQVGGTITGGVYGIHFTQSAVVGGLTNTGTITGGDFAVHLDYSTLSGGLTNAGVIQGGRTGINLNYSSLGGGIYNSGTISGVANYGITLSNSTLSGGLTNAGVILGNGGVRQNIHLINSVVIGDIVNSGSVGGSRTGISLNNNGLTGGVANSGLVSGTQSGISLVLSTVAGGISNSATNTITGGQFGLYIDPSVISGGITNSGLMQGTTQAGLFLSLSTVSGGVQNLSGGTISGGATGVNLIGSAIVGGLTNSGLIAGTSNALVVDSLSSLDRIVVAGNNTASFSGAVIAPDTPVTVAGGATYTLNSNFTVSGFNNAGTLVVPGSATATPVITGSFANTGTFSPTVNSVTDYAQLTVTGVATLGGALNVLAQNSSVTTGATLTGLLRASTLTGAFASVNDNSVLVNFSPVYGATGLDLAVVAASSDAIEQALSATGNVAGMGAAKVLDALSSNPGAMQPVFTALNQMTTDQQVSNAVSSTLPVLSADSPINTLAVLMSINQSIEARTLQLRGISTGQEITGNSSVWMKPFGSRTNQGNENGAYGFKANTGGLILGADTMPTSTTRLGTAFAWGSSSATSNMTTSQTQTTNMYQFIGYGAHALTNTVNVSFQANGGWNSNNSSRSISFMGTTAKAEYNSAVWHAGVGIDRPMYYGDKTTLIPSARFDYSWVRNQSYSESGASNGLGLNVGAQTYQTSVLAVDAKVIQKLSDHNSVNANVGVGYNFSPTQTFVSASYQGAAAMQFTTTGVNPNAVMGRAGLGYTYKINDSVDVGIRYDIDFQNQYTNQTATAKAKWTF